MKKHSLPSTQSIWSVACRNKYVVTGDVEGKVKTWIQDDPYEMEKEWTVSDMSIISVASTGSIVIVSSMDSRITAWDIVSGEKIREIECGPVNNWAVAVNPVNPDLVATTGQSGHIHIWDIKSGARVQVLETQNSKFTMSVAWVRFLSPFTNFKTQKPVLTPPFFDTILHYQLFIHRALMENGSPAAAWTESLQFSTKQAPASTAS